MGFLDRLHGTPDDDAADYEAAQSPTVKAKAVAQNAQARTHGAKAATDRKPAAPARTELAPLSAETRPRRLVMNVRGW